MKQSLQCAIEPENENNMGKGEHKDDINITKLRDALGLPAERCSDNGSEQEEILRPSEPGKGTNDSEQNSRFKKITCNI